MSATIYETLPYQVRIDLTEYGAWRVVILGRGLNTLAVYIQSEITELCRIRKPSRQQLNMWDVTGNISRGHKLCTTDRAWMQLRERGKTSFLIFRDDLFNRDDYGKRLESLNRWIALVGFRSIVGDQIHDAEIIQPNFTDRSNLST